MILQRRNLLKLALALPLAGCGGGVQLGFGPIKGGGGGDTGGSGSFTSRVVTATLELPDALASLRSGLRLNTSLSEATFSGDGTAKATLYGEGPQILIASQGDDTPVLLGWADSSAGKLSPQTTAEVLLYIATGAHTLHPDAATVVRGFLRTAPAVATLASQVTTALAADPKALARPDGALATAVTQAARAITPPRGRAIRVDPSQEKSGIQPIQVGATQVQLQHTIRRRAYAYLEQIASLEASPTGGAAIRRDLSSPVPLKSFDVPRTTGVSSVNGVIVDGLLMGQTAYGPVLSDPVTLPLKPDGAVGAIYRLVTVGPSGGPMVASERPYFTRERDDKFMALTGLTMVFDWAISLVLNTILGLEGAPGVPGYGAFADAIGPDCANFLLSTVPGALDKLVPNGDFVGVGKDLAYALATSNSARTALGLIVAKFYGVLAARGLVKVIESAALGKLVERALIVFSVAGAALNAFDILVTLDNVGQANPIDSWEVTVTQPKVTLSPETATLAPGDTLSLLGRAVDEQGSGNLVSYHWTITSGSGTLRNPVSGLTGTSIDSASTSMTYQSSADAADKETVTIELEAFLGSVNSSSRTSLGKATSTLTIKKEDVPFGSVLLTLSSVPSPDLDPTLKRLLGRVRAQVVSDSSAYIEPVWELFGGGGATQTILIMALDFGSGVKKGQTIPLAKTESRAPVFIQLGGPTTGGARVRFFANAGSLRVVEVYEDGKSVPRHIQFVASGSFYAQDAPELTFSATMRGWMTDIRRWGDPPT